MSSNCIVEDKAIFSALSPVAKHIAAHDMSAKLECNLFANMVTDALASGAKTKAEYLEYLRPFEEEILAIREAKGEKVKSNSGKWLHTKVSMSPDGSKPTSSYRVNKSVIGKAFDFGVPLAVNGKPLAKDVIEKSYKAKQEAAVENHFETALRGWSMLVNTWNDLSASDQEAFRNNMRLYTDGA